MIEFLTTFCIVAMIFYIFLGGGMAVRAVGKSIKDKFRTCPIKVKNTKNADGRFRVVNAWYSTEGNCYYAEIHVKEGMRLKVQAHSKDDLEEGILYHYKQLEEGKDYLSEGDYRIEVKDF